jgi:PAS domain S-box-containing protein
MRSSPQNSALFDHSSMGIVVVNQDGEIQAINPFALKLFGYEHEEVTNKPIETLIPGRFRHKHVHHRHAYTHHPKSRPMGVGMDLFAVRKDGTEFPVEVSLGNYQNNGAESVIAFISDITIRKKAQEEIVKLNDELEETVEKRTKELRETLLQLQVSSKKLEDTLSYQNALLDNAGAMIIATDEKGLIKLFNPEASLNLGYRESEVINKKRITILHNKREIEMRRRELQQKFGIDIKDDFEVLIEKSRRNIHKEEQYTYIRKDDTSLPISLTLTTILDNADMITGFMVIAIDISQRKKAEEDLKTALEKANELSELKSNFVSMASHEFRTPLSTILSSAYLIEKYTTSDEQSKRERHLRRIISSVNMLTDILNDFLSVGKIEEGKIQVKLSEFNIENFISLIVEEIKDNLKKKQEISYTHEGSSEVVLDPSLLKHIVMNLVSNASKFSPENTCIEMKTSVNVNRFMLSVKDHGIGISKVDQQHLTERFFRATNAGNIQGTGLGLHIVSKYAELMNGSLSYESELGKGTEFIITLILKK